MTKTQLDYQQELLNLLKKIAKVLIQEDENNRGIKMTLEKMTIAIYDQCVFEKVKAELERFVEKWKLGKTGYKFTKGINVPFFKALINEYAKQNQSSSLVGQCTWTILIDLNDKATNAASYAGDPYAPFLTIYFNL